MAQALDAFRGGFQFREGLANRCEQLIAGLVQYHAFANSFKELAAEFGFKRFEAVADG